MIKTIIFDFGDVFINLDKPATERELSKLGLKTTRNLDTLESINQSYETGSITTEEFLNHYQQLIPQASIHQIKHAWNVILKDFPKYRLDFIQKLANKKQYQLILLSNTNELHIDWIKKNISFFTTFKSCFDAFYLSHEIHLRKPNTAIFQFVLDTHQIQANETLFIDDTAANTDTAHQLGIHVWNNDPSTEDIIDLFTIKSDVF